MRSDEPNEDCLEPERDFHYETVVIPFDVEDKPVVVTRLCEVEREQARVIGGRAARRQALAEDRRDRARVV